MARKKPSTNKAASNSEASTRNHKGKRQRRILKRLMMSLRMIKSIGMPMTTMRRGSLSPNDNQYEDQEWSLPTSWRASVSNQRWWQKKTDWHWKLAIAMFEKHDVFCKSFKLVLDAQRQERIMALRVEYQQLVRLASHGWIKSKIAFDMRSITAKHIADMGQTGAGLKSADEIAEGTPLHTKWAEGASSEAEVVDGWQNSDIDHNEEPATVPTPSSEFGTGMSDSKEDLPVELFAKEDLSSPLPRPRTTARPNSSKPAVATPARNTKRSKIGGDIFAVAELEASTHEKELTMKLELEKARIVAEARERVELAKVNQEVILEREKRKTERNRQRHERFMMKFQSRANPSGPTHAAPAQVLHILLQFLACQHNLQVFLGASVTLTPATGYLVVQIQQLLRVQFDQTLCDRVSRSDARPIAAVFNQSKATLRLATSSLTTLTSFPTASTESSRHAILAFTSFLTFTVLICAFHALINVSNLFDELFEVLSDLFDFCEDTSIVDGTEEHHELGLDNPFRTSSSIMSSSVPHINGTEEHHEVTMPDLSISGSYPGTHVPPAGVVAAGLGKHTHCHWSSPQQETPVFPRLAATAAGSTIAGAPYPAKTTGPSGVMTASHGPCGSVGVGGV
ncbi:hypothetical protein BDQ17DRAFT_1427422 [Cyathus striatus]|nr:hypothetical protein BDQ17DRAFT_1427422 [Cyathus striatus]